MFDDDDYLWYLIHWMFDGYLCAAGTRTALRCLGTTQAAAGMPRCRKWWTNEPIPQKPRNGAQFPWHFHLKTVTWPSWSTPNLKTNGTLNSRSLRYKLLYEQALRDQYGSQISKNAVFSERGTCRDSTWICFTCFLTPEKSSVFNVSFFLVPVGLQDSSIVNIWNNPIKHNTMQYDI